MTRALLLLLPLPLVLPLYCWYRFIADTALPPLLLAYRHYEVVRPYWRSLQTSTLRSCFSAQYYREVSLSRLLCNVPLRMPADSHSVLLPYYRKLYCRIWDFGWVACEICAIPLSTKLPRYCSIASLWESRKIVKILLVNGLLGLIYRKIKWNTVLCMCARVCLCFSRDQDRFFHPLLKKVP